MDGGCDRVKSLVGGLVAAGNKTVFGIIDWDLKNEQTGNVVVLGYGNRYSIENYVLDPLLVGALLLRDKLVSRETVGLANDETYIDLRSFPSERLQEVAKAVLVLCGVNPDEESEWQVCNYVNGASVKLPQSFLRQNGHSLEELLKEKFEGLRKYHNEGQLKLEILDKILDDLPGLLPADFLTVLRTIQGG
jgi:hypothetical protein